MLKSLKKEKMLERNCPLGMESHLEFSKAEAQEY